MFEAGRRVGWLHDGRSGVHCSPVAVRGCKLRAQEQSAADEQTPRQENTHQLSPSLLCGMVTMTHK